MSVGLLSQHRSSRLVSSHHIMELLSIPTLLLVSFAFLLYSISLVTYRLFFSPIAKFPGPKLAASTFWYEFYYDVIKKGQYTWKLAELHKKYGIPICLLMHPHEHPLTLPNKAQSSASTPTNSTSTTPTTTTPSTPAPPAVPLNGPGPPKCSASQSPASRPKATNCTASAVALSKTSSPRPRCAGSSRRCSRSSISLLRDSGISRERGRILMCATCIRHSRRTW